MAIERDPGLPALRRLIAELGRDGDGGRFERSLREEYHLLLLPLLHRLTAEGDEKAVSRFLEEPFVLFLRASGALEVRRMSRRMAIAFVIEGHPRPLDSQATARELGEAILSLLERKPWSEKRREPGAAPASAAEEARWIARVLWEGEDQAGLDPDACLEARRVLRKADNPFGKMFTATFLDDDHGMLVSGGGFAWRRWLRTVTEHEATLALLGARLHLALEGMPPPSLETLVEKGMLPRLPQDPYAGKPLRYDGVRGIVWSVGDDGQDDGGVKRPEEPWLEEARYDDVFSIKQREESGRAR